MKIILLLLTAAAATPFDKHRQRTNWQYERWYTIDGEEWKLRLRRPWEKPTRNQRMFEELFPGDATYESCP